MHEHLLVALPDGCQTLVQQAYFAKVAKWVEQAWFLQLIAFYFYGGLRTDVLDQKIHNYNKLEPLRAHDPYLVVGSVIGKKGGKCESNTIGWSPTSESLAELLTMSAKRMLAPDARSRSTGPQATACAMFEDWACRHGFLGHNDVHRTMGNRVSCLQPRGQHNFTIVHFGSWRDRNCPDSRAKEKCFTKAVYKPTDTHGTSLNLLPTKASSCLRLEGS